MLGDLIQGVPVRRRTGDLTSRISGITQDSRKVEPGSLFVAITGTDLDGHDFVQEAIRRGAAAIIGSRSMPMARKVPTLIVDDTRKALADVSARFYGEPTLHLRVAGVTGTNGKTSITYLAESILREAGRRPAVLGTINVRYGDRTFPSENTTPESVDLQRLFGVMRSEEVTDVVMEVSSHALAMERVRGIHFDVAAFTNLSQDHLDFHRDLEDYFGAKRRLFSEYLKASQKKDRCAVINMEDPRASALLEAAAGQKVRVGLNGPYEISCHSYELSEEGVRAAVLVEGEPLEIRSSLIGRFNLENILIAVGIAKGLGVPAEAIARGIEKMRHVPGRLERIPNDRGLHIFVDYAHTPDALGRVGENLRGFASKKLITVFGCGGDRDCSKRPLMGREAGRFSDWVIVTSDNPRTEDPERIIDEILPGLRETPVPPSRILKVVSREEALRKALQIARPGDFLLVAGKGHEDYQILGKRKIHFSDQEILRKLLGEAVPRNEIND